MPDTISVVFSVINSVVSFLGLVTVIYGMRYFKEGLPVKSLRRGVLVTLLIFVHFMLDALGELGTVSSPPVIGHVLELAFTLALGYLAYGFIRDWQKIGG